MALKGGAVGHGVPDVGVALNAEVRAGEHRRVYLQRVNIHLSEITGSGKAAVRQVWVEEPSWR